MSELFLIAQLAGRPVAFASADVESVVDLGEVVPVPRVDARVRGVAALRSRVVTVIDSRLALGEMSVASSTRAVVAAIDGHSYAFLVDALDDVTPFPRQPVDGTVSLDRHWQAAVCGLIDRDGEPVPVLRPAALLPAILPVAAGVH